MQPPQDSGTASNPDGHRKTRTLIAAGLPTGCSLIAIAVEFFIDTRRSFACSRRVHTSPVSRVAVALAWLRIPPQRWLSRPGLDGYRLSLHTVALRLVCGRTVSADLATQRPFQAGNVPLVSGDRRQADLPYSWARSPHRPPDRRIFSIASSVRFERGVVDTDRLLSDDGSAYGPAECGL